MKVAILNAYSSSNRGDGLLVELALELVREADPQAEVVVAAHDPESFAYLDVATVAPLGRDGKKVEAIRGVLAFISGGRLGFHREAVKSLRDAGLIISVGGAYLRGGHLTELFKSTVVHVSQLRWASRQVRDNGTPWILLPQSIGPYGGPTRRLLKRLLRSAGVVYLRDDRSMLEFGDLPSARRTSDCAVLAVASRPNDESSHSGGGTALVLRAVRSAPGFSDAISRTLGGRTDWIPILQASRRGNDDSKYYRSLGIDADRSLRDVSNESSACLSVRLHGALEAIALGVPSVHLAYERKGFSAFADLGLERFVFDARDFDPQSVLQVLEELHQDPEEYWAAVRTKLPALRERRSEVVASLRASSLGLALAVRKS